MRTEIKLVAGFDTGEGDIRIMPHFESMNSLWQLDVLKDWIYDLDNEYNRRMCVWRDEGKKLRKKGMARRKKLGEKEIDKHGICAPDACYQHNLPEEESNASIQ